MTKEIQQRLVAAGCADAHLEAFICRRPRVPRVSGCNGSLLKPPFRRKLPSAKGRLSGSRDVHRLAFGFAGLLCEYLNDAQNRLKTGQLKPGEDVKIIGGKVRVSGQVAVMAINGLLTKVMFDKNPNNEFFVEESFPLDWMCPASDAVRVIMKINRKPLPTFTEDIFERDHEFWSQYSERLIGNWITYDTPISNIVSFVEKVYPASNWSRLTEGQKKVCAR